MTDTALTGTALTDAAAQGPAAQAPATKGPALKDTAVKDTSSVDVTEQTQPAPAGLLAAATAELELKPALEAVLMVVDEPATEDHLAKVLDRPRRAVGIICGRNGGGTGRAQPCPRNLSPAGNV